MCGTLESRALPTPYTLDRTGLPYRLTGVAANRTHTLTLATRPGTPRDARARGETVYAVYTVADTAHRCAFVSLQCRSQRR